MPKRNASKAGSRKRQSPPTAARRPIRATEPADGARQDHEAPSAKEVANTPRRPVVAARGTTARADGEPRAKRGRRAEAAPRRPSGLDLAAKALASSREPLNAKAIAKRVLAMGWSTGGKTPHATLYAAIIREIAARGRDARFRKTERGLFAATSAGKGA